MQIVGIDLGTTNSVIGVMRDGRPHLISNPFGDFLTPSVVGVDEAGEILIGHVAKEYQVLNPQRCASCFKRQMGTDWTAKLGSHTFSAIQLSSLVLTALKNDAEALLKQSVERAVITVPAYFNNEQRQATIEAGRLAGFKVERIINEPTAAALAYGVHESDAEKTIAVFDLGGGTFDISIVEFFHGAVEVRASAGESILGGEDFTRAIARKLLADRSIMFEHAELKTPMMVSRLLQQCEKAKRQLSSSDTAEVMMPTPNGELDPNASPAIVDREMLRQACLPLTKQIAVPIRRAMGDAKLVRQELHQVILVGGATRMPLIVDLATEMFGLAPTGDSNPDEVVAQGAAIQAGLIDEDAALDDLVVVDVAPFTLGVEIAKRFGTESRAGYFLPILNRNTVIPASRSHLVSTIEPNQDCISLKVYQGESRRVEDNLLLGSLEIRGVSRGPAGQEIDVRFTYDNNGVLEVEATIVKTNKKFRLVITKHAKNLSSKQLKAALAKMETLKILPRETLANRFLLKRAQRLYQELPTMLRYELEVLLDVFEEALERQDPVEVEHVRQPLELFLSLHDVWPDEAN